MAAIKALTGEDNDFLKIVMPAAATGKVEAVRRYLKADRSFLTRVGPHGRTMLWEAARKGKVEMVEYLHGLGADLERRGCYFSETMAELTPWCIATVRKKKVMASWLAERGASCGLDSACFLGDLDSVRASLGADPAALNAPFYADEGPLHFAIAGAAFSDSEAAFEVFCELLDRGAEIGAEGATLVRWALGEREPRMVPRLLDAGAEPLSGDVQEAMLDPIWHPVFAARGYELDINAPNRLGFPPLVEACRGNHNDPDDPDRVRELIARGAEVDGRDYKQKTALHRAAQAGHVQSIRALIDAGAEVDARDRDEETPLFDAVRYGRAGAVRTLLAAGASRGCENRLGRRPADLAKRSRKPQADEVRDLLQKD